MSTQQTKHVHKLKRHTYKTTGSKVFFCANGDCNFKIEVPLSLGKHTLCWRCGNEFPIDEYSIRLAKPHCTNCRKVKGESNESHNVDRRQSADRRQPLTEKRDSLNDIRSRLRSNRVEKEDIL